MAGWLSVQSLSNREEKVGCNLLFFHLSSLYLRLEKVDTNLFSISSFASPYFISLSTFVMVVRKLKIESDFFVNEKFIPSLLTWLRHISHKATRFYLNWETMSIPGSPSLSPSFLPILCSHSNSLSLSPFRWSEFVGRNQKTEDIIHSVPNTGIGKRVSF